jgi:hypothetical protein
MEAPVHQLDRRAKKDGSPELAATIGARRRKHPEGEDQRLPTASNGAQCPTSSRVMDNNLGLSAQSRMTFGPIEGVGCGSLADAQKQGNPFKVSETFRRGGHRA